MALSKIHVDISIVICFTYCPDMRMKGRISKTIYLTGQFWLIEVCNPDYETGVRFSVTVSLLFLTTTFHNPNVLRFFFFFCSCPLLFDRSAPNSVLRHVQVAGRHFVFINFFSKQFCFFLSFLSSFFSPFPDNSNS